jgi:hypothetical protein
MAVPFVVWTVTGLLFHLKPGWGRAYDLLSERSGGTLELEGLVDAAAAARAAGGEAVSRVELFASALGPIYRIDRGGATTLVDARTAAVLSPLAGEAARAVAVDAVARSPHAASYGAAALVAVGDDEVRVRFSGGAEVRVDRRSARLSQRGADTDRIDWLYRAHYVQWTGVKTLDRVLSLAAIAGTWLVAGLGILLFVRQRR